MKVLVVASHIYDKDIYADKRVVNGLAIMVRSIFDQVSLTCDCYGYATNVFAVKQNDKERFRLLSVSKKEALNTLSLSDYLWCLKESLRLCKSIKNLMIIRMVQRLFLKYYFQIRPEIVNFHDLSEANITLMELCEKHKIPYVLTDHLYVGKNNTDISYRKLAKLESIFYGKKCVNASVVSTGVKRRILLDFPSVNPDSIHVIGNGTDVVKSTINTECGFKPEKIVFLCVGNIMERKNQTQIIKAAQLLPASVREQIQIIFIGKDTSSVFNERIVAAGCSELMEYVGVVPYDEMCHYYSIADYTITVSLNEGFGLTIIEGFVYGVPAILYEDLDSFDDIYDDKSCLAIRERDDLSLAKALERAVNLRNTWDRDYIQKYSEKFSMQQVGEKYIEMFNSIINN